MKPPHSPLKESLLLWGLCFLAIVVAMVFFSPWAKIVATVCFLYLPVWSMRERNEYHSDYGVTLKHWKRDLAWASAFSACILPLYVLGFVAFVELVPHFPAPLAKLLAPYSREASFQFRLPDRFPEWIIDQLFVVALPEEFFYRGYLQRRLRLSFPGGREVFGVRLGPAFWVTAVLFALGHLAIFQAWRLAVFFPALLFGWLREKTDTVVGAAIFHAVCNLTVLVLEASFFGPR